MAHSTRAALLVLVAALAVPTISKAAPTPDDMARQHFESGAAYLQESDLDSALIEFQKAYELSGRPQILVSMATVHERLGQPGLAADELEKYLALEPEADDRATYEVRIKNLRKRAAEAPPEPAATPEPPPPAPVAPAPAPKPAGNDAPGTSEPASAEPNRLPAVIAFGVAGAAGAGALVTQILANSKHADLKNECSPSCTDDDVSGGKTLATTSLILAGVAVVGAGIGGVLWFTAEPEQEQVAAMPRVVLDAGPGAASARATWSF